TSDLRSLASRSHKRVEVRCEKRDIATGAVFEDERKSSGCSDARDCGRRETERCSFREFGQFLVQPLFDRLILFFRFLTIAPLLQRDEHESVVTGPYETQQAESDHGRRVFNARGVSENLFDPFAHFIGTLKRRGVRKLEIDVEVTLILVWKEA